LLALLRRIRDAIARWWADFTLQTRLLGVATLVVSLVMSGLTFWAVNAIQQDARMNDTRFGRDLGLLLAANVAPPIAEGDLESVAQFSGRFYRSTESVRYILYADESGQIFFGVPFSDSEPQSELTLQRRIELPEGYAADSEAPFVRQHVTPNGEVTDVFVPLRHEGKYLGVLALGINPNPTVVASANLTRDVTIAVFIAIWALVLLGIVFNALTITKPIKELVAGVRNIAAGNFKQRIELPFGGELGELIASFNHMAERLKRYEEQNIEELTAEKAKLDTLVSTIADGAVLLDANLQVVLVNPTARRIFGWQQRDPVGENVLYHLPAAVTVEITQPLYRIAAGETLEPEGSEPTHTEGPEHGSQWRDGGEFRITLDAPNQRTVRILLTQVFGQSREGVKGIAMTVQDITREAELNAAKSQFISNVSHELRTPLFNIKSFVETLNEYGEELGGQERQEFLQTANHEADRLTRLVNDVLDLSRLESGRSYRFSAIDLAQAIEQTVRNYHLNAQEREIELKSELESQLPPVWGNYDLLLQVLTNLVGNSLKFTSAGGQVTLRAYRFDGERAHAYEGERVRVAVADTGIGIAPEDKAAIFDRFYRVEDRVHTLEGTGLGLSIVKNIVEKHHSQIHLESEVGVGTTFWFDLPVYQPHDGEADATAELESSEQPSDMPLTSS